MSTKAGSQGLSLIEVVIFIVVLSVGFAAMLILYNQVTRSSVDPLVRKQALAIAQSLLEEIELMPYTYCDPDDANVTTATSAAIGPTGCAATPEGLGKEGTETRYSNSQRFDNVNDYSDFCMGPGCPAPSDAVITTVTGTPVTGLADYRVAVSIQQVGAVPPFNLVAADAGLSITVTATHVPTGTIASLTGFRFRYAPNSP